MKAELAGKTDRVMQLRQEIAENERQLDMAQVRTGVQCRDVVVQCVAIFSGKLRENIQDYKERIRNVRCEEM